MHMHSPEHGTHYTLLRKLKLILPLKSVWWNYNNFLCGIVANKRKLTGIFTAENILIFLRMK